MKSYDDEKINELIKYYTELNKQFGFENIKPISSDFFKKETSNPPGWFVYLQNI